MTAPGASGACSAAASVGPAPGVRRGRVGRPGFGPEIINKIEKLNLNTLLLP